MLAQHQARISSEQQRRFFVVFPRNTSAWACVRWPRRRSHASREGLRASSHLGRAEVGQVGLPADPQSQRLRLLRLCTSSH